MRIEIDDSCTLAWHADAAFAAYPDLRSRAGSILRLGKGLVISRSSAQKQKAHSNTESEMNCADNRISVALWAKLFAEHQG